MLKCFSLFCLLISGLLLTAPVYAQSENEHLLAPEPVNISTEQSLVLHGQFFQTPKSKGGVLILHDCNSDIDTYLGLATSFQQQNIDALVLNLRALAKVLVILTHIN